MGCGKERYLTKLGFWAILIVEEENTKRKGAGMKKLIDWLVRLDWFYVYAAVVGTIVIGLVLCWCPVIARAEVVDVNKLADSIYKAEGGSKTSHPYGILQHYKTTTPRQACINTIRHALRDWDGRGDFIRFLGNRYCPVQGKYLTNDEQRLNKYWVGNVNYFYGR